MSGSAEQKKRTRQVAWFSALVVFMTTLGMVAAPKAFAADLEDCAGGSVQIIAHQDDDLLFQSPDILRDVDQQRCVRTVYITAGDGGYEDDYWESREEGAEAAWADMAGVDNDWDASTISLAGKTAQLRTLSDSPNVSLIFMRLPDGFPLGTGSSRHGNQSLYRLLTGAISSISSIDGKASYTTSTLRSALLAAVEDKDFTWIRTQDFVTYYGGDQDHYDHHSAAFLGVDTMNGYDNDVILSGYLGYGDFVNNGRWPQNISGTDLDRKESAFDAYSNYDDEVDWDEYWNRGWIQRQYVIGIQGSTSAANAGADQEVDAGQVVTLDGTGSTGVSGLSYNWTQTGGPSISLSSATASKPTFTPTEEGDYTFELTVTGGGASSTDDVTISVSGSTTIDNDGNLALESGVTATASSAASGQPASAVRDGSALGYPADASKEWSTSGGKAGSWVKLTWPSAVTSDRVVLYDRPNTADQVLSGTLTFSDGSTVAVGALDNAGGATTVTFAQKTFTSVQFTVNSVSSTTQNVGLAEFQVFGSTAAALAANAGPDQSVVANSLVTLDGSASTGSSLSYQWTKTSGPNATLSSATVAKPTFTPTATGTYVFQLTVKSGSQTATDSVSVTVTEAGQTNVARQSGVTVTQSSQLTNSQGTKAIDGVISGYPTDDTKEWSTNAGKAGSWIKLTWPSAVTSDRVVLYDRPNTADQVLSGTLTFSDGSTVAVGALDNAGGATTVTFAQKTFTSVQFTVNSVSSSTYETGLAEFEVYGGAATQTPQAPVANAGPDQSVVANSLVTLDGSASTGSSLSYQWTKTSGPNATLSSATVAKPTFTPTATGTYVFQLTVKSGSQTATDSVSVTVTEAGQTNVARQSGVTVTQSSQLTNSQGTKAIDGVISGYPTDDTKEWSTNRGKAGSWIKLTWPSAVTSDRVVLYDRPNTADQVLSGTLTFSDGSTVAVGALDNAGGATTVTFAQKTFTSVQFTVNSVSSSTYEAGLAEFEVYGGAATQTPQAPVANAGSNQSVTKGAVVTLDGSASTGSSLSYQWTQTAGAAVQLSDATAAKPTFAATATGTFTFQLKVSSGTESSTASVTVTVSDAPATTTNVARQSGVTVTQSSQQRNSQGTKAIDGVISGYPTDSSKEWSTNGSKAGSWIKLAWSSPVTVNKIVLYDRPNTDDQVLSGTLTFSDGSTVAVGALDNAGGATTITFDPKTITSVQFTVNSVSSSTYEVGLAEFEVYAA